MINDGGLRVVDEGGYLPGLAAAMMQWTRAAQIAMSRTDAM